MARSFAAATVIVLVVAVFATRNFGPMLHFRFAPSNAPQPPQHLRYGDTGAAADEPLTGDAPWALSALPDCFHQEQQWSGTATYVEAHLPRGMRPVPAGTRLVFGECTIFVGNGELMVRRGTDRFRIPPHATLYRGDGGLALLRSTGHSTVLRSYTITTR